MHALCHHVVYVSWLSGTVKSALILHKLAGGETCIAVFIIPVAELQVVVVGVAVPQQVPLPLLEDFFELRVGEGELPEEGVAFADAEDFHEGVDRVHTVLNSATTTGAGNLRAHRYLVLFFIGGLKRHFGWAILLDKIVTRLLRNVIVDHEITRSFRPIWFCP